MKLFLKIVTVLLCVLLLEICIILYNYWHQKSQNASNYFTYNIIYMSTTKCIWLCEQEYLPKDTSNRLNRISG